MLPFLPRSFYLKPTPQVAKALLGQYLVRNLNGRALIGKIVETEAYLGPQDLASHSRFGKTTRNAPMFDQAGYSYVYLIYGIYYCLNVVTQDPFTAEAVLIRALEPVENIDSKTSGPGLLCRALSIDRTINGIDLTKNGPLSLHQGIDIPKSQINVSSRVGVQYAASWANKPLRFYLKANPYVSMKKVQS